MDDRTRRLTADAVRGGHCPLTGLDGHPRHGLAIGEVHGQQVRYCQIIDIAWQVTSDGQVTVHACTPARHDNTCPGDAEPHPRENPS